MGLVDTPVINRRRLLRFWDKVNTDGECWIWTRNLRDGYGRFHLGGSKPHMVQAHRFAYELVSGPIPECLQLDHLCRNRACVRPDHLEAVKQIENMQRGNGAPARNSRKTHCKRGHPFDLFNTRHIVAGRQCKQCRRDYMREYMKKWRARS